MNYVEKISKIYDVKFFLFPVKAFQFSMFYEKEAKYDKRSFKRVLTLTFKINN